MSGPMAPVPEDHPLMIAWRKYREGPEYQNSFDWAAQAEYREGSMWAAFEAGFASAAAYFAARENLR